jgi:1-acyl-sn-glycerol-3-phosphate acyltransferase
MPVSKKLPFYTGLFYYFIRPIARIGIWMYYRKIYLSHLDRIPKNKPVIMAANHPTGFMEPCVMAVFMRRPLYFLVRGDFFRKPIFNFLLRSLNMIPIFRGRDGNFKDLKSNYASFEACYQALRQNRTIMIFPEGNAKHEKRLRPIQKGVSRMAFGAFENSDDLEDLYIVPVGVSYTYSERPRSEMMVSCAAPISVREILQETDHHFASFDKKLRARLTADMRSNLVHIHDAADEPLVELLQQINRADVRDRRVFPVLSDDDRLLAVDRQVTEQVQQWSKEKKAQLQAQAQELFQDLQQYHIPVHMLTQKQGIQWWRVLLLVVTALPIWLGYAFTFPATAPARWIADTKVKRAEFYSPVSLATHLGTFLIFFLLILLICLISGFWWLLPISIGLSVLSYGSVLWRESLQKLVWQRRYSRIAAQDISDLKQQWQAIKTAIGT